MNKTIIYVLGMQTWRECGRKNVTQFKENLENMIKYLKNS